MDIVKFTAWLNNELKIRDWTQADLARKIRISESHISMMMAGKRGLSTRSFLAISKALKIPQNKVFGAAGLLPEKKSDQWVEAMTILLGHVSTTDRKAVETILRTYAEMGEK